MSPSETADHGLDLEGDWTLTVLISVGRSQDPFFLAEGEVRLNISHMIMTFLLLKIK